jgi:hypothetical protein
MRTDIVIDLNSGSKVEVTGGWRKLGNAELNNLCFSPDVISRIK